MDSIPYGRQNLAPKDFAAVLRTLRSEWITQGPAIAHFEESAARYVGARYAVAVMNGTVALHLAYLSAGIKPGDEILMPANTFAATANAALYLQARPVFVDIEPSHGNINPAELEKKLTVRTKAIVPVHFAGHPCTMAEIMSFARKHGLVVIEDAAHALGASYRGTPIGGLSTLATMFSFHPVKSITTGEGGMLVTNKLSFAQRCRLLRSHGIVKNASGKNVMRELGFNYRMTDFQAALGSSQLTRLPAFLRSRHQIVRWYREFLGDCSYVILPFEEPDVISAWHLYVIRVQKAADRDPLYRHLQKNGIGVNFHYPPVYGHPFYRKNGYRSVSLPETERYAASCITLPLHTLLTKKQVDWISQCIRTFFQQGHR